MIIILKNIFVNRKVRIMKYIIGLDIGIGSVGWAVVRNDDDCKRLEDFGARIFESGEIIESNKNIRKVKEEENTEVCEEELGEGIIERNG